MAIFLFCHNALGLPVSRHMVIWRCQNEMRGVRVCLFCYRGVRSVTRSGRRVTQTQINIIYENQKLLPSFFLTVTLGVGLNKLTSMSRPKVCYFCFRNFKSLFSNTFPPIDLDIRKSGWTYSGRKRNRRMNEWMEGRTNFLL